jgi:hypothetical protein
MNLLENTYYLEKMPKVSRLLKKKYINNKEKDNHKNSSALFSTINQIQY